MTDWKEVARRVWEIGLAFPKDEPIPLVRYSVVRHPSWPRGVVRSPKDVRTFLWEHRKTRQANRARGVVWRRDVGDGRVEVGLGAWTAPDVPATRPDRLSVVEFG